MRVPHLGPGGEGWVGGRVVLLGAIGAAGLARVRDEPDLNASSVMTAGLGALAILIGAALAIRGILDLGRSLTPMPRPVDANRLVETGTYRLVRHPIYSGLVLAGLGWGIATLSPLAVALALGLFVWLDLKARIEEAWLADRHPGYGAYRARTRKFIPFIY